MNYDDLYQFSFRLGSVGTVDIGDLKNVISEYRYFYVGQDRNGNVKERLYVQTVDISDKNQSNLIPIEQIDSDMLHRWLEATVHPDNLVHMKQAIHEMFIPPITYRELDFFNKK